MLDFYDEQISAIEYFRSWIRMSKKLNACQLQVRLHYKITVKKKKHHNKTQKQYSPVQRFFFQISDNTPCPETITAEISFRFHTYANYSKYLFQTVKQTKALIKKKEKKEK